MVKKKESKTWCSKCDKEIKKKDENKIVAMEGLEICKKCAKKIIARCHTCREPIYENDLTYEITPNWSAEHIFGIGQSEKVIQCDWCYLEWLEEQEQKIRWWRKRKWIVGICSVSLLFIILFWLYPTLEEIWIKLSNKGKYRPWIVSICLLVLSFIIIIVLYWVISAEFGSRYKDRREIRKERRVKRKK